MKTFFRWIFRSFEREKQPDTMFCLYMNNFNKKKR